MSNQCGQVIGGNPDLEPEEADTYALGVTITPSALPNFTASIDYYRIELDNAVGALPGAFLFTQCMATGEEQFCSQIRRTALGSLSGSSVASGGYILQTGVNVGQAEVSGIDVQTTYTLDLGDSGHALTATLNGAFLEEATATPVPGAGSYDCAGLYGTICQTINPEWRHNLRLTWGTPWELDVSLQWRYIGSAKSRPERLGPGPAVRRVGRVRRVQRRAAGHELPRPFCDVECPGLPDAARGNHQPAQRGSTDRRNGNLGYGIGQYVSNLRYARPAGVPRHDGPLLAPVKHELQRPRVNGGARGRGFEPGRLRDEPVRVFVSRARAPPPR